MKGSCIALILILLPLYLNAQVKVKGIVTEANINPTSGVVKKPLPGVQVKALGAIAPEVSDNSGYFTLIFDGKKPGDILRGVSFQKYGYEIFNHDILESWKVASDPNWVEKIKLCPVGTIDQLSVNNYKSLYNTLNVQYEKKKKELKKLQISDAELNERYKALEETYNSQKQHLEEYADRFARVDFDDVSDLYRKAFNLFSKGELDSVAMVLEEANLLTRTDQRLTERQRIKLVKNEVEKREQENDSGIKADMQALKMLAQAYTMHFEYEKASPLYDRLVKLDSSNFENLIMSAYFFGETNQYDRAILLLTRIIDNIDSNDWHKGSAYIYIGILQKKIGFFEPAIKNLKEGYKTFQYFYELDKKNETYLTGCITSISELGEIYINMGNQVESMKWVSENILLIKSNLELKPNEEWLKNSLAVMFERLGNINQAIGHMEDALKYFDENFRLLKELNETNQNSELLKNNLASSYRKIGEIYQAMGHLDDALNYYERYMELSKEVFEANEKIEYLKINYAGSYEKLGGINQDMGLMDDALKYFEKYLLLSDELYEANPKNEMLKNNHSASYGKIGNFYLDIGHLDDALIYISEAYNSIKELYNANPKNELTKYNLASLSEKLGEIHQAKGHMDEALKYFEMFMQLSNEFFDSNPKNESLKYLRAASYGKLGEIHQAMGHKEDAYKYFEEYLLFSEELFEANPKNELLKQGFAVSCERLGNILQSMEHMEEAIKYFNKEVSLFKELYAANPKNELLKESFASSYEKLGEIYQIMGQLDSARFYFYQESMLLKKFNETNSKNITLKKKLAYLYDKLGVINISLGHNEEALIYFEEAVRSLNEFYGTNPENEMQKKDLIALYESFGQMHHSTGQNMQALKLFEECNQLIKELYESNPQNMNFKNSIVISNSNLSWYYLFTKQFIQSESAACSAIDLAQKNNTVDSVFNVVYTNLAHSLLFQNKYEEAKKIYLEFKDKPYPQNTSKTFKYFFLQDFDELEKAGITHPDMAKIRALLNQ